jgi:acetoin utilization protein AcuB
LKIRKKGGQGMLVCNWMTKKVYSVEADDPINNAIKLLEEHDIKMLPVMEKGSLIGIITDRDLKKASASNATSLEKHELNYLISRIKIREIMINHPVTVPADYTIEETAELLLINKISGVPVVSHGKQVIGIITKSDLFRVIVSLSGFGKKGIHLAFQVEDRPGSITEILDIIREYRGRIGSILTSYENVPKGYRKVYIRTYGIAKPSFEKLKNILRANTNMLYMVDHRHNTREIY